MSRWSPQQKEQLKALQSGQWWPFHRADAQVLAYLHRLAARKEKPTNHYEEALL